MRISCYSILFAVPLVVQMSSAQSSDPSTSDPTLPSAAPAAAGPQSTPPAVNGSAKAKAKAKPTDLVGAQSGATGRSAIVGVDKWWSVTASMEYHRLFRQNDLGGAGANRNVNFYSASFAYNITPEDQIRLQGFLYQRFLADPGETGLRLDDTVLSYRRIIRFPYQMMLRPGIFVTAPTSFSSQKQGNISSPTIFTSFSKTFFGYLTVEPRISSTYFISRYRNAEGGSSNPKFRIGAGLTIEASMPFHTPLAIGVDMGTSYFWSYSTAAAQAGSGDPNFPGTVQDSNYPMRGPMQQTYGFEAYVRYVFPSLYGVQSDFAISFANGDPNLGYTSTIHDGARFVYFGYRRVGEVYFTLSARY